MGGVCHTHLIMSQSVRTKNKPPRTSGPREGYQFQIGERLGKLETEVAYIKEDIAEIKNNMATKADITALRESMDSSRESAKADTAALRESTKAEIASLKESTKADLVKTENRILRWIVGSMGTLIIAILGLIVAFVLRSL